MRKPFHVSLCLLTFLSQLAVPIRLAAQTSSTNPGFDPNHILEDNDIFGLNGMNYASLVRFLRVHGPLADADLRDIDGVIKPAPDIIWRVATSYQLNPKYLLALLQKEQSLVEDPHPSQNQYDWATGFAICDNCSKDDPDVQEFKGFASQLEWAAKQHREKYLLQLLGNGQTRSGKAPGKAMTIDNQTITPVNNATAMLYSYTPHIHGNLNLWKIWKRWFQLQYPDGTVVKALPSGKTYLIRLGQKHIFASRSVIESLVDTQKILSTTDAELASYPDGSSIKFPKFALLQDEEKHLWLLLGDTRREIVDMKVFRKFGFNEDELLDVQSQELADYSVAAPITQTTEFPQGHVLQDVSTKFLWYVEDDTLHRIPDPVFLRLYFRGRQVKQVNAKKIALYNVGTTYHLHDGELVRGIKQPAVYVVENGTLRPISSAEIFEGMGWKWKNVVVVPDSLLADYTVGAPLTL